jgi:two-component sensor histidine kinase
MNTQSAPWTPSDGSLGFEVVLDSVPSAGSMARRQIEGLTDHLPALSLRDLQVVVTELVNNSVVHGSGRPIEVTVAVTADGFTRGTVSDRGVGPVEIAPPRDGGDGGLGLRIVDALASRWGVNQPSSDVWFELAPAS